MLYNLSNGMQKMSYFYNIKQRNVTRMERADLAAFAD
jgi:hypothetical protein